MKKITIASLTALVLLSGCNTFQGLGKDVSKAGDAVTDTAHKVEKKI